mmetsp:Transcript_8334/g.18190  ORF Transcript_8334/g.18190 Transcript_8334/m.18190 type:complete len:213 (+) Transcript_8334:105-743(+)
MRHTTHVPSCFAFGMGHRHRQASTSQSCGRDLQTFASLTEGSLPAVSTSHISLPTPLSTLSGHTLSPWISPHQEPCGQFCCVTWLWATSTPSPAPPTTSSPTASPPPSPPSTAPTRQDRGGRTRRCVGGLTRMRCVSGGQLGTRRCPGQRWMHSRSLSRRNGRSSHGCGCASLSLDQRHATEASEDHAGLGTRSPAMAKARDPSSWNTTLSS